MKKDIPWLILEKYFSNSADKKEKTAIELWKNEEPENRVIFDQLLGFFKEYKYLPADFIPDTYAAYNKLTNRFERKSKQFIIRFAVWYKIAAVFITGIMVLGLFQLKTNKKSDQYTVIATNNTTVTSILLPDSSIVWINGSSTLRYITDFDLKREVHLTGEAYFEVVKDPDHPFIVYTENASIKVLGTRFNVRSFANDTNSSVSVIEGLLSFGNSASEVMLHKNETGIFNTLTNAIEVSSKMDQNAIAWKTHIFMFDDQSLKEIFECLARVYDFSFRFEREDLNQRKLTSGFSDLPEEKIMEIIALAADVTIKKENHNIYVIKSCN